MVCQPLAFALFDRKDGTLSVRHSPGVIAEIKFGQIAVQVLFGAVLIDALHAAFEDAEIALDGVRMDLATGIFLAGVVHR